MPSIIVAFLFGAGSDAQAAVLLIIVNTSCAHANVEFNSKIIGWLFTTNSYHFRHHSIVLHESNTNYGCAMIIWDRLFCTFEEGEPKEAGIGKRALSFREKLLMLFREPAGVDIAPIEHHAR
jgi:sterol desaturase/sphingolipid hydroxylase (fatty acid hydroxylase superfamily)